MKTIINTPIFHLPRDWFYGDNVIHYLPAKYLWHKCNIANEEFQQPVYDFSFKDNVQIDFAFFPEHPQNLYFKKPVWIRNFLTAYNTKQANDIAKDYDYFINNYGYRGAIPIERNWGYSDELQVIELSVGAYTYKAVYEYGLYLDDLELTDRYSEFLKETYSEINPENRPVIALSMRNNDPWGRHLPNSQQLCENFLFQLLEAYPKHMIILLGHSLKYFHSPRIKYLGLYINKRQIEKKLGEYSACLQFILAAFFCRNVDLVFVSISGFSLFIASIRPPNLIPPVPLFWAEHTFNSTSCPWMQKMSFKCPEVIEYNKKHPEDKAFKFETVNFLLHSRNEELLYPYCMDFPNTSAKAFQLLEKLETKYQLGIKMKKPISPNISIKTSFSIFQRSFQTIINSCFQVKRRVKSYVLKSLLRK